MTCSTNSEYYQIIKVFPNCLRGVVVHGAVGQASAGDKWLYPDVAEKYDANWKAVERNIRN
ncbi:MAG: sporulation initiation factor Spo0A C-terminal domain-containing protein [Oscillospiraceae bacterium]